MLLQTTFDRDLDEEIRQKTLAGTLTEDEKAFIVMSNTIGSIMGDLCGTIRGQFGLEPLTEVQEVRDVSEV